MTPDVAARSPANSGVSQARRFCGVNRERAGSFGDRVRLLRALVSLPGSLLLGLAVVLERSVLALAALLRLIAAPSLLTSIAVHPGHCVLDLVRDASLVVLSVLLALSLATLPVPASLLLAVVASSLLLLPVVAAALTALLVLSALLLARVLTALVVSALLAVLLAATLLVVAAELLILLVSTLLSPLLAVLLGLVAPLASLLAPVAVHPGHRVLDLVCEPALALLSSLPAVLVLSPAELLTLLSPLSFPLLVLAAELAVLLVASLLTASLTALLLAPLELGLAPVLVSLVRAMSALLSLIVELSALRASLLVLVLST